MQNAENQVKNQQQQSNSNTIFTVQGVFVATSLSPIGSGGNIVINTDQLNLLDGARLTVASTLLADSGNIIINANRLFLENAGISATSNSGSGGNINLNITEQIELVNGSEITARAGVVASVDPNGDITLQDSINSGNGGNISIKSPIIIAFPDKTNQITGNASSGHGGNINIQTQAIIGNSLLDINASSQLGIDGIIEINNPNIDSLSSLVPNNTQPQDSSEQIVAGCSAEQGHRFVVRGKGGVSNDPTQSLNQQLIWEDQRSWNDSPVKKQKNPLVTGNSQKKNTLTNRSNFNQLIPAQSWVINQDGTITLTAKKIDRQLKTNYSNSNC